WERVGVMGALPIHRCFSRPARFAAGRSCGWPEVRRRLYIHPCGDNCAACPSCWAMTRGEESGKFVVPPSGGLCVRSMKAVGHLIGNRASTHQPPEGGTTNKRESYAPF